MTFSSVSADPVRVDEPVALVRAVSHVYGTARALDGLDVEIPAGCMVGLIGPDGVGKSTLMGLIAGSKRIQTGNVRVLGGDMNDSRPSRGSLSADRLHASGAGQESVP